MRGFVAIFSRLRCCQGCCADASALCACVVDGVGGRCVGFELSVLVEGCGDEVVAVDAQGMR